MNETPAMHDQITPEAMREMAERLGKSPERPMRDVYLGNGTTVRAPILSTFLQDEQDRKEAAAMLRAIAGEREAWAQTKSSKFPFRPKIYIRPTPETSK